MTRCRSRQTWFIALAVAFVVGCATPTPLGFLSGSRQIEADAAAAQAKAAVARPQADINDPKETALRKAEGVAPPAEEEALAGVLDELAEIRAIEPEAAEQLLADLRQAKPEYYPLIVQQFRAALDYRRQTAQREARDDKGRVADDEAGRKRDSPSSRVPRPQSKLADTRTAAPPRVTVLDPREEATLVAASDDGRGERADTPKVHVLPAPSEASSGEAFDEAPVTATDDAGAEHADGRFQTISYTAPAGNLPAAGASAVNAGDWHAQLEATIAALRQSVKPQPTTVEEIHDHMRLRALALLAGHEEEAYQPIPGASAPLQDYWSKQLFAIGAYLDASPQLDDKQRAAAALVHLDQARSKLSELATLQLRNIAFVDSVDGFGVYKPLKEAKFKPGQQVTVYCEVENFRSSTNADGYETSLGTSYQVLDESGHRVEGAQFPDVKDACRNRRRDFHMQYDLSLPTQIYAGAYQLELTITDHNAGKIGQAKLRFEIVGGETR